MSNHVESTFAPLESELTMISRELTLIVAATNKMGIGRGGTLPWTGLKKEMAYFARVTKRANEHDGDLMATIDISRSHALEKDEARRRAEALAQDMQQKLGIRWRWEGDKIKFDAPSGAAKGATGTVYVEPTDVRVEVDLPFLLRAVKGAVESKINQKLDDLLRKP